MVLYRFVNEQDILTDFVMLFRVRIDNWQLRAAESVSYSLSSRDTIKLYIYCILT